jgi:AcrR family transcriptional regulator
MPNKRATQEASEPDLREACVQAAREVIAEQGIEKLSLRDVARRLGVSHQAPYKHFASRDHLLAEVMRRCYHGFAEHLDMRPRSDNPSDELHALGVQYLNYASKHPLEYHLMFSTPWPQPADHPELAREAAHAFSILRSVLNRVHGPSDQENDAVDIDSLYIWSAMHGLAGILQTSCISHLHLKNRIIKTAPEHAMKMISYAMEMRHRLARVETTDS